MSKTILTKHCSHCKEIKPIKNFPRNRTTKDGYRDQCKVCHNIDNKTYRQTDKGKAYHKAYRKSEKGVRIAKRHNLRFPEKYKARYKVSNAVYMGMLPPANTLLCHYCNEPAHLYHHWKGYEPKYALDVVPACRKCDRIQHQFAFFLLK